MLNLRVTIDGPCKDEQGRVVTGQVEYCGHVFGGMVKVRLPSGEKVVVHPQSIKELRR
jgi:hypothetical protein